MTKRFWCDLAAIGGSAEASVLIEVAAGEITAVTSGIERPSDAVWLRGLTLPGMANVHSHAFQRALRHRTQGEPGSFWTWREQMYRLAERLDPDSYYRLAKATFAEMVCAGFTTVGEFHYIHHQPGGKPYANANAMAEAVLAAAAAAGIRITLIDTLYQQGGIAGGAYVDPSPLQQRFCDASTDAWLARISAQRTHGNQRLGVAVHSVRAVQPHAISVAAGLPGVRHVHVSEQVAENEQVRSALGKSPTQVLFDAGFLGPSTTIVHGTHLDANDVSLLGSSRTNVCFCPTTERDLADGVGPGDALIAAGSALCLGTDSQSVIDPFEEARAIELNGRLVSHRRGTHTAATLLQAASSNGHRALGWDDVGTIAVGQRCDLVTLKLDSTRLAGVAEQVAIAAAVYAATSADVSNVVVDGAFVVRDGLHVNIEVVKDLEAAIAALVQ